MGAVEVNAVLVDLRPQFLLAKRGQMVKNYKKLSKNCPKMADKNDSVQVRSPIRMLSCWHIIHIHLGCPLTIFPAFDKVTKIA